MVRVGLFSQFHHFLQLIVQTLLVWTYLPYHLVPVQAKHELWLAPDSVVFGYFGRNVAVDLDDFQEAVLSCKIVDLLISYFAVRVPASSEVDEGVVEFLFIEVGVEGLEAAKGLEVGVEESSCISQHFNIIIQYQSVKKKARNMTRSITAIPQIPIIFSTLLFRSIPGRIASEISSPPTKPPTCAIESIDDPIEKRKEKITRIPIVQQRVDLT